MRACCLTTLDELEPYTDGWEHLAGGVPFRGWTWLSNWWRHYRPKNEAEALWTHLAVLCVFDDYDALIGIAPWYLDDSPIQGRVLRALGSGEVCSDYLGILCRPGGEEAVVEALADYLATETLDALRWDLLQLDGIDAEDRVTFALVDRMAELGCTVHRRPGLNCWRLELPTDWDRYVASLGKNLRRDLRRLERELLGSSRLVLHSATRIDELPRAMDILVDLHQRRREKLGDAGCFASDRFLAFYRDVVPGLLRCGQVQFNWLELDGRPVAAEYQLAGDGILYAYQAGIDPDTLDAQPGKLINVAILRGAIADGYRAFDFLRGDEPYKARFGAKPRPSMEFRIVPRRTIPQIRHNLWLAGSSVKKWVKRGVQGQGPQVEEMTSHR